MKNVKVILLSLMRKKRGNWDKAQSLIGNEIMLKFESDGYLSRIGDEWFISPEAQALAVKTVFTNL